MISIESVQSFSPNVVFTDPADAGFPITVTQEWDGPRVRTKLRNDGERPVRIHEVILADLPHGMPGDTKIYGEGFTHLSSTGGTIAEPARIGSYTDRGHYKMPMPEDATTLYGLLLLSPPGKDHVLLGFTTALSYCGKLQLRIDSVQAVLEAEDIAIDPGEVWNMEDFVVLTGPDRAALLDEFADQLAERHKPDAMPEEPPTGWCSWYCFGPGVTVENIRANMDFMSGQFPQLKFVQIDDGYQAAMGDWLETGSAFGGGIREIIQEIRDRGFEPAIWVAPFIAQKDSRVFQEHPDWFVKDEDGKPLPSDRVTFGGWRFGPWYALDGSHPEAQAHLLNVFKTMRSEWGIKYFKLDACFWGAMHGGYRFDPKVTRIKAYRQGLEIIKRGSDRAFILVCNHPIWPSMGLASGWRTSNDIRRTWESFRKTGRENMLRNWANGRLLWNDPDCILLTGDMPENEFQFHASVIYASGGAVLSGDDMPTIPPHRLAMLKKLLPPTGIAARFVDESMEVGRIDLPDRSIICLFNWDDSPKKIAFQLDKRLRVTDFWTAEDLGEFEGVVEINLDGRSANLLECGA